MVVYLWDSLNFLFHLYCLVTQPFFHPYSKLLFDFRSLPEVHRPQIEFLTFFFSLDALALHRSCHIFLWVTQTETFVYTAPLTQFWAFSTLQTLFAIGWKHSDPGFLQLWKDHPAKPRKSHIAVKFLRQNFLNSPVIRASSAQWS